MNFLINCSNLKISGGLQVADSICCQLNRYTQHSFFVVLSSYMDNTRQRICNYDNVTIFTYTIPDSFNTIVLGRDGYLDSLVNQNRVDAVFTVFGPSRWKPRVPHFSGFAMPALVIPESPFFSKLSLKERIRWALWIKIRKWSFQKTSKYYWTENPYISKKLKRLLKGKEVYTVSNYYNQVFDDSSSWRRNCRLPEFDGVTCLSVSSPIEHKNFEIIPDIISILKKKYPQKNFRFAVTFDKGDIDFPDNVLNNIVFLGKVDVSEVPYLYEQCDIMFMPTLLECFTATYPEAMRMGKPIVTTDLEFARGLCGEAACYYSALDANDAAEAIYRVATDEEYSRRLVENGKNQLQSFDSYKQRADKLIQLLENIVTIEKNN